MRIYVSKIIDTTTFNFCKHSVFFKLRCASDLACYGMPCILVNVTSISFAT